MRQVLFLRAYNYFYFSQFALFLSFLPIYLAERDISTTNIGLMLGLGSLIGVVSQPLWGMISDKYKVVKKVLLLLIAISVVIGGLLYRSTELVPLFVGISLMYFFFLPTDPLVESFNYRVSLQYKVNFGSIRMFGALGFAMASSIIGYVGKHYGIGSLAILFLVYGVITLLLCSLLVEVPAASKPVAMREIGLFFRSKQTLWFLGLVLFLAVPHRMNDNYIGIYIKSLGGDVQLVGQAWTVMTIIEVVFFAISHYFIKPGKELAVIAVAASFYALRFALSAIVTDPAALMWLQLLQGVSFVLFYAASIQYLYAIVPEEWKATGQTVLAVLLFGVSSIISATVGGWFIDQYGGAMLYGAMAIWSVAAMLLCLLIMLKQRKGDPA
ncbi:MFS transporter [Paenibacillus algorifonticola]|uniref:MFS transporter n=1 Tax=Paenibacillus algorifonticola TaxID=684063 RepID=UPI003D294430